MARQEGVKEVLLGYLYDHFVLAAGVAYTEISFFQVPVGQVIPGTAIQKTYRHTNMTQGGFLGGAIKTFTITSFYISPSSFMLSREVDNFIDGHGVLWINDKPYPDYFTLNMFMGGPQWRESVRGLAAAPEFRAHTGDGRIDNRAFFQAPYYIEIDTFESFRANVVWRVPFTPEENMILGLIFFGRAERPSS